MANQEAVFIEPRSDETLCDIHHWPDADLGRRLVVEMRAKHGTGGVNVCTACLERARKNAS